MSASKNYEVPSWLLGGPTVELARGTHVRVCTQVARQGRVGPERVTVVMTKAHAVELRDLLSDAIAKLDHIHATAGKGPAET